MPSNGQTLSDRAGQWVIDEVHPEARILSVQRLKGGVSSPVYHVRLEMNGEETAVVLRQFDDAEWLKSQPDLALREAESLRRASRVIGVQTPKLIAYDEDGSRCGTPAMFMTRLEGEVVLGPADKSRWLNGMAESLARIHAVEAEDFPWTFAPYSDASTLDTSSWSEFPDKWRTAADIVTGTRPSFAKRFIHRDYHPANVLWSGGEVSGVVDWVNGCTGPAGIDVGHCRVNLAQLHDAATADEFLDAYRRCAGASFTYDPYWDLVTLIDFAYWPPEVYRGWTDLGFPGLTDKIIGERLDRYLLSLLKRFS